MCVCLSRCRFRSIFSSWEKRIKRSCCPPGYKWDHSKNSKTPITLACSVPNSHQVPAKQTRPASLLTRVCCCMFIRSIQWHWMHTYAIYFNKMRQETLSSHARVGSCLQKFQNLMLRTCLWVICAETEEPTQGAPFVLCHKLCFGFKTCRAKGHYLHGLWLVNNFFTWGKSSFSIPDWGHWRRLQVVHQPAAVFWGAVLRALQPSGTATAVSMQ